MNFKKTVYSAVRWTVLAMFVSAVLGLLQVMVLSRLLVPADFGLMAVVLALLAFAQIFSDVGVSNAVIHNQTISQNELSSLFWLNVGGGGGVSLFVAILSPLIAHLYSAPDLQPLLALASISIFISSFGQLFRVLAEKDLRFAALSKVELISSVVGFVVAVIWAFLWKNVYALAAGLLATSASLTVLSWHSLSDRWRPSFHFKWPDIRRFLAFGGFTMANNAVNMVNVQADIFVGGRFLPPYALGLYSLPRDLSLRVAGLINPVVTRVGLPVMARIQHDQNLLRDVYLKTLRMTASVNFPVYMVIAAFSREIVDLLFGPQWAGSAPLLRILAAWGMLRSVGNPVGSLIFATGRADLAFKWNAGLVLVVWPVLWLGAQSGPVGLSLATFSLAAVLLLPAWYILVRPLCGAGFQEYFENLMRPLVPALAALIPSHLLVSGIEDGIQKLAVGLITFGSIYLLASAWLNRPWLDAVGRLVFERNSRE